MINQSIVYQILLALLSLLIRPIFQSTSKRFRQRSTGIGFNDAFNDNIHPGNTNERTGEHREDRKTSHQPTSLPCSESVALVVGIVQPEHTSDAVGEPCREQRRRDTDQVIEYRHPHSQEERCSIEQKDEKRPSAPSD